MKLFDDELRLPLLLLLLLLLLYKKHYPNFTYMINGFKYICRRKYRVLHLLMFMGCSTSSSLSLKRFNLKLRPMSNKVISITLKVELTPYSLGRLSLYALS